MKDILTKAIEKAVENGFDKPESWIGELPEVNTIIFSHGFAVSFFGFEISPPICAYNRALRVDDICPICGSGSNTPCLDLNSWIFIYGRNEGWEYHLQQMVLEEEPLKYLEKFLG